jgi:hypothetical protein
MTFGVANIDRATLINNVTLLAKVAKEFGVPVVLTAVETESFSGYMWPQLLDVLSAPTATTTHALKLTAFRGTQNDSIGHASKHSTAIS